MLRQGRVFGTWNSMDKVRKGGKRGDLFNAGWSNQGNVAELKMNEAKRWEAGLEATGWSLCMNQNQDNH